MKGLLFISHQTAKYSTLESIEIALKGGCKHIQLRMKEATTEEIALTGKKALLLCREYQANLYIDDQVEICKTLQANGVHLGKNDMPPSEARHILGNTYCIGGTANTWEDILHLKKEGIDYIGLGPYNYTTTKKNLSSILGLKGYEELLTLCKKNKIEIPILAIGGITLEDIPSLLKIGVSGIALSATILNAEHPIEETKRIIEIIQNNNYETIKNWR